MNFNKKEQLAMSFIEKGQPEEAISLLSELIVAASENNDFAKADSLRQTLISSNSMALTEIIHTGEILEDSRYHAIDKNHKILWRKLYKNFSPEEATEFYYNLKTVTLRPEKMIIQQGKLNDKLFFVNKGTLKAICKSRKTEVFLKEITSGEACGLSTFFQISTATTSVMTNSIVNISYINQKAINNITKKMPGFDVKLKELCKNLVRIQSKEVIAKKNIERRKSKRMPAKGSIEARLLGAEDTPVGNPFFGTFEDLSLGGLAFRIKASKQEQAQALLGSKATIKITLKNDENLTIETKKGWIVSIRDHLFGNYSISFRFRTPLSRQILHQLAKA